MLRKSLFVLVSLVLVVGMLPAGALASTSTDETKNVKEVYGVGNEYTEAQSLKIIEATETMEEFVFKQGNQLVIDPKAKMKVDSFVYEHFHKGVNMINDSVQNGEMSLDKFETSVSGNGKMISPMEYTDRHWWGMEWYLTYSEAQYWETYFDDWSFNWATVAAIAAITGAAPALIAAVLMSVGNQYLYREIRDNTSWRGTELTFRWATPWVWAQPR